MDRSACSTVTYLGASHVAHGFGIVPAFLGDEGTRLVEAMETETTDLR